MATDLASGRDYRGLNGPAKPQPRATTRRPSRTGLFGVRAGQLVGTQVAAAAVLIGARHGNIALAASVPVAVIVLGLCWLRLRGRWAFEWIAVVADYRGRGHKVPLDPVGTAVLRLVAPSSRVEQTELGGDPTAVIAADTGLTAVLELGDPTGLLAEDTATAPGLAALLPSVGSEHPPVSIQLLLTGAPAPAVRAGAGTPATSYRQLTEGRLLGYSRALLAVQVRRAEGWSEDELRRALTGLVRKLVRRLATAQARPLGEAATLRVIAELAHDDGVSPAEESWSGVRVGGLTQATFCLRRWPDLQVETSQRLVSRLLALPATATTVSVTVGPRPAIGHNPVELTVRLAAPEPSALSFATQALRKVLSAEQAHARRLDGEHLHGLLATLPLGGRATGVPGFVVKTAPAADQIDGLQLPISAAGLMLGANRHGSPMVIRLFRPEQTRALLVGGVRCAQLVALRAMALGARVIVQTARPQAWDPFVRGAAVPGESIAVVPPGRGIDITPGSAVHPLLVVVDIGPVGPDTRPGAGWQATLVVRDDFSPADVDAASRADLLVLQQLRPDEATLLGSALGLGEAAQWLTKIRPDMVGVVNRRAVRWAALSQTPIEAQLIGPPDR